MKGKLFVILIVVLTGIMILAVAVRPTRDRAAKKQRDLLQGNWLAVSIEEFGKLLPDQKLKDRKVKVTFKEDSIAWEQEGTTARLTFTVDPTQKPKAMDLIMNIQGTVTWEAIYELDGDTLKFHQGGLGVKRPKEFKTDAKGTSSLIVFQREKK